MSVTLLSSRLKEGRDEEGAPKALQVQGQAAGEQSDGPSHQLRRMVLRGGLPCRLTWNGGCDCWLDGVGLLHEGLDAGEGGVESQKSRLEQWLRPRFGRGLPGLGAQLHPAPPP